LLECNQTGRLPSPEDVVPQNIVDLSAEPEANKADGLLPGAVQNSAAKPELPWNASDCDRRFERESKFSGFHRPSEFLRLNQTRVIAIRIVSGSSKGRGNLLGKHIPA
jgi:hypothetical protein